MSRYEGIPPLIYGTAFKFEKSTELVLAALKAGFRGIDTAGSQQAYREKLVGDAIAAAIAEGILQRHELWIQTKFSPFRPGKDPAKFPYDVTAPIETRVSQSLKSSLANLQTTYLDSVIMHSPCPTLEETLATWAALEPLVPDTVSALGVSNFDLPTLTALWDVAKVKPSVVQNRFTQDTVAHPTPGFPDDLPYSEDPYDAAVRRFCAEKGIAYTPWGLLWGNPRLVEEEDVFERVGKEIGVTKEVVLFGCMRGLEGRVSILCGTGTVERMGETVGGMARIEEVKGKGGEVGEKLEEGVKRLRAIVDVQEV